jgi:hypothetical protein
LTAVILSAIDGALDKTEQTQWSCVPGGVTDCSMARAADKSGVSNPSVGCTVLHRTVGISDANVSATPSSNIFHCWRYGTCNRVQLKRSDLR